MSAAAPAYGHPMTYAQPQMTYGAPSAMTYAAPSYEHQPVTYAAPHQMAYAAPTQMTYAAPQAQMVQHQMVHQAPVTYAAPAAPQQYTIPQQYFEQYDQNHDGVISQEEYMQFQQSPYAAPAVQYHQPAPAMTYAAPQQMTYAAPQYEHQPVTYAAPQQMTYAAPQYEHQPVTYAAPQATGYLQSAPSMVAYPQASSMYQFSAAPAESTPLPVTAPKTAGTRDAVVEDTPAPKKASKKDSKKKDSKKKKGGCC